MRSVFRLLLLFVLLAQVFAAPKAQADDWLYTVRPQDKLWNLAEKFCGTHTRWRDLASHNQIPNPLNLRAGTQIRIPLEWLIEEPALVRVVYARGDVRIEWARNGNQADKAADGSGTELQVQGAELGIGSRVLTGQESYANVQFADGSILQIGPESIVQFDTLSAFRDTGMVDSRIRIDRGSGASTVESQKGPGAVYRISTPLGVAAVRGTEFRTRSENGTSFIETVGGAVDFVAPTGKRSVERGFGLKADVSGVAVEELLPPPALFAPQPYGAHESVNWQSLLGAASYLVQVYSGPDLAQVLTQAEASDTRFALASLSPGAYVLGVRGVAASGLQGFEATQTLTVKRAIEAPQNIRVSQLRRQPELLVTWDSVSGATGYEVVATPLAEGTPLVESTAATEVRFTGLEPGKYSVHVQAQSADLQGAVSAPVESRIRRPFNWGLGVVLLAIAVVL